MDFSDCPRYWPLGRTNWAPVWGRCQGPGHFTEHTFFLGLVSGPAGLFFKPYHLQTISVHMSNSIDKNVQSLKKRHEMGRGSSPRRNNLIHCIKKN